MSDFMKILFFFFLLLVSNAEADIPSVVINEIHYDPDVKTELVEFVELHNAGTRDIDISGWYFSDGISFQFPNGTILPAGGYIVVTEDPYLAYQPTTIMDKYGVDSRSVYGPFAGRLSNEGERIILRDATGGKVDEVDYRIGFPWPTVGDAVPENLPAVLSSDSYNTSSGYSGQAGRPGTGHSIQLVNPSFDNDLAGSWRSAYPTPVARNQEVYADNIPPHIRQVEHSPKQPKSGEVVTITAKVTDPDGVTGVMLLYQLVEPGNYINIKDLTYQLNWNSVAMYDDGLNGDEQAGDDIYTVQLPGTLQVHRRLVRYRIGVMDSTSRFLIVPYSDDPQPNFAYFVYDGVPAWRGAIRPGDQGPLGEVVEYGTDVMRSLPVYHLISKKSDVEDCTWFDQISWTSPEASIFKWYGTLIYDGKVYDHIRYRARGGVWRYSMGKNMWKFNFNRGHSFQGRDDYGRKYSTKWDKLNFSACIQQGDYQHRGEQGMFEAVTFKMFNLMGVEASKTNWLQFRIIDEADEFGPTQYEGDLWGLYLAMEQVDGRFLDEHNLPDGNLYRMNSQSGDEMNNQGPTAATDWSDLWAFISGYQSRPDELWWRDNVNLDSYYGYRCVVEGTHHGDIGYGKNYSFYLNPQTNIWSVFPWDVDLTWANNMYGDGEDPYRKQGRITQRPSLMVEQQNKLREFHDLLYNADQMNQLIDEFAAIIDDPNAPLTIVDVDRAMWDYNPVMASFYVNPSKAGQGRFYQRASTKDFRGMVQIMKDYVVSNDRAFNTYFDDALIPGTPVITATCPPAYPINSLTFETSPFSDPQGSHTFAVLKWRIAEVEPGSQYVPPPSSTLPETVILLEPESQDWKYFKGNNGEPSSPVDAWRQLNFNDSSWYQGQTSIGYGDSDDNTILDDMRNNYSTVYLRHKFNVSDIDKIGTLIMGVYVDDGCIVWINGTEVARLYVSDGFKAYNDFANNHEAEWEQVTLPMPYEYIVEGENIIAVHALNASLDSSDLSIDVALAAITNQSTEEPNNPPANTFTDRREPGRYEIDAIWESDEITEFNNTIQIPAYVVQPGHTYRVRCRMKDDTGRWSHWSVPIQFVAGESLSTNIPNNLRITELMYNPADADIAKGELNVDNDEFEFIELKNIGNETLDLTNVSFVEGINFDFANGSIVSLTPGAFILVVKNKTAFESRYGAGVSNKIAGEYSGKLANEGEKISLADIWHGTIVEFEYSDGNGWPQSTDGEGNSLVPLASAILGEPDGSLNDGGNWRASTNIGGSPGQDDP
jgi:hypothetical protein